MKKRIHPFWLTLAVLLRVAAMALTVFAARGGTLRLQPDGYPQDVVIEFLDALIAGDEARACACLSDYSALGLDHEPADATGRALYDALRQSYAYTLEGPCDIQKLEASQSLRFRSLDVKAVEAEVAGRVEEIAEELVAERSAAEIYDEDGGYLPSFTDEVYAQALDKVLAYADDYCTETELTLPLRYVGGSWKLQTTPALISALLGGL